MHDNSESESDEESKPPINNVFNEQEEDDDDALNEHTVGGRDEDENDGELDTSNYSIGSVGGGAILMSCNLLYQMYKLHNACYRRMRSNLLLRLKVQRNKNKGFQ